MGERLKELNFVERKFWLFDSRIRRVRVDTLALILDGCLHFSWRLPFSSLNYPFSKSFPPFLAHVYLPKFDHSVLLAVTGAGSIDEYGRLSRPNRLLAHYNIVILTNLYSLTTRR